MKKISEVYTRDELERALSYWQRGNENNYSGLCAYFMHRDDIHHRSTLKVLEEQGHLERGIGTKGLYIGGESYKPEPRVEVLKKMLKQWNNEDTHGE